jgi:hypothetical protein
MTQLTFEPPAGTPGASALSGSPSGSVALGTGSRWRTRHRLPAPGRPRRVAMAVRSRLAWALALTAISLAVTGAAAPASPATALTAPYTLTTLRAEGPPSGWVTTTDPTSGISVMLPGQPTINQTTTIAADGKSIQIRAYACNLSGSNGVVVFVIADGASGTADLDAAMQSITSTSGSNGTVTSSRHFVLDGHPALDGRFTVTIRDIPAVGLARFVSDSDHLVGIATSGPVTEEDTLARLHQQVLHTLRLS